MTVDQVTNLVLYPIACRNLGPRPAPIFKFSNLPACQYETKYPLLQTNMYLAKY